MTASQSALFKHRKARGVRQQDLARLAHIAQSDIVSFEKRRRLPSIGQAKRIALVLGLKVTALFTDGFREQSKHTGRPIKPYMPPEPTPRPIRGPRPADSIRIICPHCGASSYSLFEGDIPGLAFKCFSCGRAFGMDGSMAETVTPKAVHDRPSYARDREDSLVTKERKSAGQRRRHAREREMRDERIK
jgi:transcriptional regulator with XRE-family HTH domain